MCRISPTAIFGNGLRVLVPVAAALTVYLYLYPVFSTCGFPLPPANHSGGLDDVDTGLTAFLETAKQHLQNAKGNRTDGQLERVAPFRLLALADPQLEGDSSIPSIYLGGWFPHLWDLFWHMTFRTQQPSLRQRFRQAAHDSVDIWFEDVPNAFESVRKRIDLFGNDLYLAHIYRTLHWWARPTHVVVLGDLVGSQWLEDDEFRRRADRYWQRVLRGGERVPDEVARAPAAEYDLAGYLGRSDDTEQVAMAEAWTRRVINVAGNHDVGYAGDMNEERVARFERIFGKINYELRFEPVSPRRSHMNNEAAEGVDTIKKPFSHRLQPELRIVVLNDMNLDTPVLSSELQDATYSFINSVIDTASAVEFSGHFTLILTHVPLHKPSGTCADAPFFEFHEHDGTLKEQNLLSTPASKGFLEGILGMSGDVTAPAAGKGRPGLIMNGHDHVGCDTWHFINQTAWKGDNEAEWDARMFAQAQKEALPGRDELPGVREITVRSMMGDFGGNAGLLSMWFDEEAWEWRYAYAACPLGSQHMWWLVHILDLVAVVVALVYGIMCVMHIAGVDLDVKVPVWFGTAAQHIRSVVVGETGRDGKSATVEWKKKLNGAVVDGEARQGEAKAALAQ